MINRSAAGGYAPVLGKFKTAAHQRDSVLQIMTYRQSCNSIVALRDVFPFHSVLQPIIAFSPQDLNIESSTLWLYFPFCSKHMLFLIAKYVFRRMNPKYITLLNKSLIQNQQTISNKQLSQIDIAEINLTGVFLNSCSLISNQSGNNLNI